MAARAPRAALPGACALSMLQRIQARVQDRTCTPPVRLAQPMSDHALRDILGADYVRPHEASRWCPSDLFR